MNPALARWIIALLAGAILGWMAGEFWKRRTVGMMGNILLGIIGALLGVNLFERLNLHATGVVGSSALAFMVSAALLMIVNIAVPRPAKLPD